MNMLKWMLALLLAANLVLIAYIQWGGDLKGDRASAESQSALNAEKIRLLKVPVSAPAATPAIMQPPAVVTAQTVTCMEWGEFSGNSLVRATEALAAFDMGDQVARHQAERSIGYWVYMPPRNSRADVDRKILELKALGVTDYFVVQDSKHWLNAISLGIFKTEEAAQAFLDKLKEKGVRSAVMGARDGKLKFSVFELKNLVPEQTEKMSALQKQFPDSELKVVDCPGGNGN